MTDPTASIANFLRHSPWENWAQQPIAGDASSRRYFRLRQDDKTVILMDAPPQNGEDTVKFAYLAVFLAGEGLCAPAVLAHAPETGLMIIEDLGETDFAATVQQNTDRQAALYEAATDVLIQLKSLQPPQHLKVMTPQVAAEMVGILGTYYARASVADLMAEVEAVMEQYAPAANTLALRDFHAANLIWRPEHSGNNRVGLLDFQDAFIAPEGYDLASLLRDARRDVPPDIVKHVTDTYCARTNAPATFRTQLACLGVQRNLRILGVFARLATEHRKPKYLAFMPRVWANILADLDTPALEQLKRCILDTVPPPTPDLLERMTV